MKPKSQKEQYNENNLLSGLNDEQEKEDSLFDNMNNSNGVVGGCNEFLNWLNKKLDKFFLCFNKEQFKVAMAEKGLIEAEQNNEQKNKNMGGERNPERKATKKRRNTFGPEELEDDLKDRNINLKHKTLNNYIFAKFYQSETYKNSNNKDEKYDILKDSSVIKTLNGLYRVLYPLDMLVKLSKLGRNPIGPYSDMENYNSIMKSNLEAIKKSISYLKLSNKVSDIIYNYIEQNQDELNNEEFINKGYELIDEIYEKIEEYLLRGEDEENIIKYIKNKLNNC